MLINFSPSTHHYRGQYLETFTKLLDSGGPDVQAIAAKIVSHFNYKIGTDRIAQGLSNDQSAVVPPERATTLIVSTGNKDYRPIIQSVFESPPNKACRFAAMKGLGQFEESRSAIRRIMLDADEDLESRYVAVDVLRANDVSSFGEYAIGLVEDAKTEDLLRAYSLAANGDQLEYARATGIE